MKYRIKAHPTMYKGVQYRSRLEARWAAFFDLIGWKHEYEPIDLQGWSPDFRVEFECGHSECPKTHVLLVEVKPYFRIEQFAGHPCMDYPYGFNDSMVPHIPLRSDSSDEEWATYNERRRKAVEQFRIEIPADASAAFGANPEVTYWQMSHGSGGGVTSLIDWIPRGYSELWRKAGNTVQWRPR